MSEREKPCRYCRDAGSPTTGGWCVFCKTKVPPVADLGAMLAEARDELAQKDVHLEAIRTAVIEFATTPSETSLAVLRHLLKF